MNYVVLRWEGTGRLCIEEPVGETKCHRCRETCQCYVVIYEMIDEKFSRTNPEIPWCESCLRDVSTEFSFTEDIDTLLVVNSL